MKSSMKITSQNSFHTRWGDLLHCLRAGRADVDLTSNRAFLGPFGPRNDSLTGQNSIPPRGCCMALFMSRPDVGYGSVWEQ